MNFFKNPNQLFWLIIIFIATVFIYIQISMRKDNLISKIFKDDSFFRLVPENILSLKKIKDFMLLAALFFIAISAAGPQWGREFVESEGFSGNIAVAVDTSLSMSASDIKPSRLESAKIAIKYLFKDLEDYRFAVIAFQGKPYIQCPMTSDYEALQNFADTLRPNMLPYPGTAIHSLINMANDYLLKYEGEKLLIIFTDGEDHHKQDLAKALEKAEKSSMKIITVGIGTTDGDLIKDDRSGEFKKDEMGHTVLSKIDENHLLNIAGKTNGKYISYSSPEAVAEEIRDFSEKMKMSKTKNSSNLYKNRYQYPLLFALLLILIEFILMEEKFSFLKIIGKKIPLFLIFFSSISSLNAQLISQKAAEGNSSYRKGDYSKAFDNYTKAYEQKNTDKILFNMGTALYKMEEYSKAQEKFEQIKDEKLKSRALYNAGNSFYMAKDNKKAIEAYRKSLLINPKDKKAIHNLQLALMQNKNSCENEKDKKQEEKKDDKQDQKNNSQNEQEKNKDKSETAEQKRAKQMLEMLKEKEKEAQKKMQQQKNQASNEKTDENDW